MSYHYCKLCSVLLFEHFGPIVQSVGDDLLKYGRRSLNFIRSSVNLPINKVKEVLCVLLKYGFVVYHRNERNIEYSIVPDRILLILRYPRYMFLIKSLLGDEAEMMLEELLKRGWDTASQIIVKIYHKTKQHSPDDQLCMISLVQKFEALVQNQFFERCIKTEVSDMKDAEKVVSTFPDLDVTALILMANGAKADPGDTNICWTVNFDKFTQDLRDQIVTSTIHKIIDDNAGELMKQMLNLMYLRTAPWKSTSNPIPYGEIKEAARKLDLPLLNQYLDQYLQLFDIAKQLEDGNLRKQAPRLLRINSLDRIVHAASYIQTLQDDACRFVQRVGDSGGGQFSINMKEAFTQLAWATLENIVLERFGSKAARIFRLVRTKKYVEQEQIQQLAMISAKEAKHLTYTLIQQNYIHVQELKKTTASSALTKIFFLFHIDVNQVIRMEIEHCYQALHNIIQRRDYESTENRRIIEKHLRVQTLTTNLKEHGATEEQLVDIAEMMTPSEKLELDKVQAIIKKTGSGELQIDETLFLLTMYLQYQ